MKDKVYCTFGHRPPLRFDALKLVNDHDYSPCEWDANYLYFYCTECEDFIFITKVTHEREIHFEGHLEGIFAKVSTCGYNGVMVCQRTLFPILNPFALHDPNLPAMERLFSYLGGIVYGRDEGIRLRAYAIQEKKLKGQMFCPASEASGMDHV